MNHSTTSSIALDLPRGAQARNGGGGAWQPEQSRNATQDARMAVVPAAARSRLSARALRLMRAD